MDLLSGLGIDAQSADTRSVTCQIIYSMAVPEVIRVISDDQPTGESRHSSIAIFKTRVATHRYSYLTRFASLATG
jgi:hypothetical protein